MSTSTYTFSTSPGFANERNISTIQSRIVEDVTNNSLIDISSQGDTIQMTFEQPLTLEDQHIVEQIVSSLDVVITQHIIQRYGPATRALNNIYLTKIGRFLFRGTEETGTIRGVEIVSCMDVGATNYTIQLVNRDTHTLLAQGTFNNTAVEVDELTIMNDFPIGQCVIDVYAQLNRPSDNAVYQVYIDEINLWV